MTSAPACNYVAELQAPRWVASDSRASLDGAGGGGPVPARGPAGAAVMGAAARVTSRGGDTRQVRPGAAVRDAGREDRRDPAARTGGDAGRRGQVAVAGELAARAGQHPPGRLEDPDRQAGQVEEVPRSSVNTKVIPAASALSLSATIRWPIRQSLVRWLCRRPALSLSTPRGSPAARVPIRLATAHAMTVVAASCWAWRTRRRCRASTKRW